MIYLITGLPGTGKSTAARRLYRSIDKVHRDAVLLDGDHMRQCWPHLKYTDEDRAENIRRMRSIAIALAKGGSDVIVSIVCPIADQRDLFHKEIGRDLLEIRLDTIFEKRPDHYYPVMEESEEYPPHILGDDSFEEWILKREKEEWEDLPTPFEVPWQEGVDYYC